MEGAFRNISTAVPEYYDTQRKDRPLHKEQNIVNNTSGKTVPDICSISAHSSCDGLCFANAS